MNILILVISIIDLVTSFHLDHDAYH